MGRRPGGAVGWTGLSLERFVLIIWSNVPARELQRLGAFLVCSTVG